MKHILIAGSGIAGMSAAWYLLKSGYKVTIIDKGKAGQGSSKDAAGMLAPVHELEFTEPDMLSIGLESRSLYSEWETEIGDIGLIRTGTLDIASGTDDVPYLKRQFDFQKSMGLQVEWKQGNEIRKMEPGVSMDVPAGIYAPEDIQVDNHFLLKKLYGALLERGATILENQELISWKETGDKVHALSSESSFVIDALVLATGVFPIQKAAVTLPKIIPVKGEMLVLSRPEDFHLEHVLRIRNRFWGNGYIVPKKDIILLGSTSEYKGYEQTNTVGGVLDILRRSYQVLPGLYELNIKEMYSGLRPASEDHRPVIQKLSGQNVFYMNGLYRHGILLGPWAGKTLCACVRERFSL